MHFSVANVLCDMEMTSKNSRGKPYLVPLAKGNSSIVCQHFQTIRPISNKMHMQPSDEGRKNVTIFGRDHMTKMTAMPLYGKKPKSAFFSRITG